MCEMVFLSVTSTNSNRNPFLTDPLIFRGCLRNYCIVGVERPCEDRNSFDEIYEAGL